MILIFLNKCFIFAVISTLPYIASMAVPKVHGPIITCNWSEISLQLSPSGLSGL